MALNVLCIGDIHIQTNNINDIKILIEKLESYIVKNTENIDIVLFMGDILHTHERLHTIPFNLATNLFEKLSKIKPLYILVGNHDYINNSQFLSTNHWMNCLKSHNNINIIDNVTLLNNKGQNVLFCPFIPDGRFKESLGTLKNFDWKLSDCIFGHQLIDGVKMGSIVTENVEKWEENYPFLISGHIHDKQKIQNNVYYTGSCIQHAFGESHDKTICLVKIDNSVTIEEIDLKLPQKQILYYDIDSLDALNKDNTHEIEKLMKNIDNTDIHYKITISGNFEQFKLFKKTSLFFELQKNNTKIIFKNKLSDILNKKHILKNTDSSNFQDILLELISNEQEKYRNKMYHVYNSFYNISSTYNNKHIVFIE